MQQKPGAVLTHGAILWGDGFENNSGVGHAFLLTNVVLLLVLFPL